MSSSNGNFENVSPSQQLLCLLAQLARRNQNSKYYSAGLRRMNRLFIDAPKPLPPTPVNEVKDANWDVKVKSSSEGLKQNSEKKKLNKKNKRSDSPQKSTTSEPCELSKQSTAETLSDLQTIFRVKSGFSLLDKEVNTVYEIFNLGESKETGSNEDLAQNNEKGDIAESNHSILDEAERMLALLNLADNLTTDCAENQRLLIERQPNLIKVGLACLNLSPDFVRRIADSSISTQNSFSMTVEKQRSFHILGALRLAACNLFVTLSSLPSGRQSLLDMCGPGPILTGLANCLSTSMCSLQMNNSSSPTCAASLADAARGLVARMSSGSVGGAAAVASNNMTNTINSVYPTKYSNLISPAMASVCAAKAAQILEFLTESSRFLILARSSTDGLQGLLLIIESALASSSPTTTNQPSSTTCHCLATLLDSLGNACQDTAFQKNILQSRKALLFGLADCLPRHTPLLNDPNHAYLIGSICRLLHNIYVGQLNQSVDNKNINGSLGMTDNLTEDCSAFCLTSSKLINSILNGIGAILDQIGHGPELRAVVIALAGRLLPLCHDTEQLSCWFGEHTATANVHLPMSDLPSRTRLLLAVLDSCSPDSRSRNNLRKGSTDDQQTDESKETNSLSSHLISGCIRCLAAGTSHSVYLRYIIGDDRRRVRRLARLIRVRSPGFIPQSRPKSNICPPPPPRDEPLAGNVCLILQHCAADTPLAEHLQGTSIIYDLLSLIQESRRLDTKRNAAILVGKLAQSSQVHRDQLSRLNGYSVLTPFNSWTAALERC
ncbi:unnamed protein product [Heterobilharzia americana]|nr:unnamed protein product [Heterobilharzia americana]